MYFAIQVSNPRVVPPVDESSFEDVASVIQSVFPMHTEDAILNWCHSVIRIGYKYDLSIMIDSLLPFLASLLHAEGGAHRVHFGSDTFMAEWRASWGDGRLAIDAKWESARTHGLSPRLDIDRAAFLKEWKGLLGKIIEVVDRTGIIIDNQGNLALLRRVHAALPGPGILYI